MNAEEPEEREQQANDCSPHHLCHTVVEQIHPATIQHDTAEQSQTVVEWLESTTLGLNSVFF